MSFHAPVASSSQLPISDILFGAKPAKKTRQRYKKGPRYLGAGPAPIQYEIGKARDRARAAMRKAGKVRLLATCSLLAFAAGLGKTTGFILECLEVLRRQGVLSKKKKWILALPTTDLVWEKYDETISLILSKFPDLTIDDAAMFLGRNADPRPGRANCRNYAVVQQVQKLGGSVKEDVCEVCPFKAWCFNEQGDENGRGYWSARARLDKAKLIITTHAMMTIGFGTLLDSYDVEHVGIDESPKFFEKFSVDETNLYETFTDLPARFQLSEQNHQIFSAGYMARIDQARALKKILKEAAERREGNLLSRLVNGLDVDKIDKIIIGFDVLQKSYAEKRNGQSKLSGKTLDQLKALPAPPPAITSQLQLWRLLKFQLERHRENPSAVFSGLELRVESIRKINSLGQPYFEQKTFIDGSYLSRAWFRRMHPSNENAPKNLTFLDATPNESLVRALADGREFHRYKISVKTDFARTFQSTENTYSPSSLTVTRQDPITKEFSTEWSALGEDIQSLIRGLRYTGKTLQATAKKLAPFCDILSDDALHDTSLITYGSERGSNGHQSNRHVVAFGRAIPSKRDIFLQACAIGDILGRVINRDLDAAEPGSPFDWFEIRTFEIICANGARYEVRAPLPGDPIARDIFLNYTAAAAEQALARLRAVNRTETDPCNLYLLSPYPGFHVFPTDLQTIDELKVGLTVTERVMAVLGGVLSTDYADLAQQCRAHGIDHWSTPKRARDRAGDLIKASAIRAADLRAHGINSGRDLKNQIQTLKSQEEKCRMGKFVGDAEACALSLEYCLLQLRARPLSRVAIRFKTGGNPTILSILPDLEPTAAAWARVRDEGRESDVLALEVLEDWSIPPQPQKPTPEPEISMDDEPETAKTPNSPLKFTDDDDDWAAHWDALLTHQTELANFARNPEPSPHTRH